MQTGCLLFSKEKTNWILSIAFQNISMIMEMLQFGVDRTDCHHFLTYHGCHNWEESDNAEEIFLRNETDDVCFYIKFQTALNGSKQIHIDFLSRISYLVE